MIADTYQIFMSVLGVFLVVALGASCRRAGWLTPNADRSLANLTAKVLLPALFFDRILSGDRIASLLDTWTPPLFGFTITVIGFLLGLGLARLLGGWMGLKDASSRSAFALGVGICNYGYIPLPLAERFYPDAMVDLILHNVGVDLALWSVGVAIISGGRGQQRHWWRSLISPPLVAVVIAMTLKRTGWVDFVPQPILLATEKLGSCSVPLGLMLSGALIIDFLKDADWGGAIRTIACAVGFRQLVMPVAILAVATFLARTVQMQQVLMLQAAMPAAIFPIVLVRLYDRDTVTSMRVILSTSIFGIVMVPFWLAVGKWWLGV
ncbi:AEC family transporter [Crateriforma conspicua]|uniref:Membrane transport protein n=1 Tax=Crateriforma conspicua TaxID=2527996 RepID=A0A5C6FTJ7_9PLAN|nr:AEC family transporter [Crateriforma conspicua]TWU66209.1 Membrane transport protein [Crateriforma conspicua]